MTNLFDSTGLSGDDAEDPNMGAGENLNKFSLSGFGGDLTSLSMGDFSDIIIDEEAAMESDYLPSPMLSPVRQGSALPKVQQTAFPAIAQQSWLPRQKKTPPALQERFSRSSQPFDASRDRHMSVTPRTMNDERVAPKIVHTMKYRKKSLARNMKPSADDFSPAINNILYSITPGDLKRRAPTPKEAERQRTMKKGV